MGQTGLQGLGGPGQSVKATRVQRERSNLDLPVELVGLQPFIIENKVFSPPDTGQLDAYAQGPLAGLVNPKLLLLSLGSPEWSAGAHLSPNGRRWRYVSYGDLAEALDAVVPSDSFDAELVHSYSAFVRTLHELARLFDGVKEDDSVEIPAAAARPLRKIRLYDGISKLRARSAIATIEAKRDSSLRDLGVKFGSDFSNSTAVLQAFLPLPNGDAIGWQYQAEQWRLAVITAKHKGSGLGVIERRHRYVAERYAGWFDFSFIVALTGQEAEVVPPTEQRGEYNSYNPSFVYRYRKAPALTLGQILRLSDHYLAAAAPSESSGDPAAYPAR